MSKLSIAFAKVTDCTERRMSAGRHVTIKLGQCFCGVVGRAQDKRGGYAAKASAYELLTF